MRGSSRARVVLALALAPFAAVAVLTVATMAAAAFGGRVALAEVVRGAGGVSFFFAFFGLPVAYAIELLVALPILALPRSSWTLARWHVLAIAGVLGAIAMPIVWAEVWGDKLDWLMLPVGAAMGLASGGVFAILGMPRSSRRDGHLTAVGADG